MAGFDSDGLSRTLRGRTHTGEAAAMVENSDYRTQSADRFAFFRGLGVARTFSTKTLSGIGTKEAVSAGSRIA